MDTLLLDLELARKLEFAEAEVAVCGAEAMQQLTPEVGTAVLQVGGGYAVYCGANSPVTQAVGLGLNGPVSAEEFDRLEEFYFSRNEPVRAETSPLADASLFALYRERGYGVTEFSNVMARQMENDEAGHRRTRWKYEASRQEMDLWTLTVAQRFARELSSDGRAHAGHEDV